MPPFEAFADVELDEELTVVGFPSLRELDLGLFEPRRQDGEEPRVLTITVRPSYNGMFPTLGFNPYPLGKYTGGIRYSPLEELNRQITQDKKPFPRERGLLDEYPLMPLKNRKEINLFTEESEEPEGLGLIRNFLLDRKYLVVVDGATRIRGFRVYRVTGYLVVNPGIRFTAEVDIKTRQGKITFRKESTPA